MLGTARGGTPADQNPRASAFSSRVQGLLSPSLLFAALAAVSAALLLVLGSRLTFLLDDWEFLVYRPGFTDEAILGPHGEHIVVIPILIYKALLATLGMESALPFRVTSTALFIVSVVLFYAYMRRRVGDWLALGAAASILFLGAAWEDLLWPFQMGYFGSMACGLGMLLALGREDRRGDPAACALLALSLGFSSLGLPFLIGAAVAIATGPRAAWLARAYVVVLPLALFAIWWLGWGREAETSISLANIATAPLFVLDGFASSIASVFGLATPRDEAEIGALDWGRPLLAAAVVLAGWRLWVLGRVSRGLLIVGAVALCFWLLAGINEKPGRTATASRYVYVGAIFTWLIAAELLRGVRLPWRALLAVFAVTALAVASNLSFLRESYQSYKGTSDLERADLGAIEIARDVVDPGFRLDEEIAQTAYVGVEAGPYLAAVDDYGSPAFAPAEIAAAEEPAQIAADIVLSRALRITFTPQEEAAGAGGPAPVIVGEPPAESGLVSGCLELQRAPAAVPWVLELPPGGVVIEARGGAAEARLRRFASESFPVEAGTVRAGETAALAIAADRATQPWQLELRSPGALTVCGGGSP